MPYSELFNSHLTNPRNVGELEGATAVAEETNPACGDRLRLSLLIIDNTVRQARFLAYGCPPTLVCGSAITELVTGKTLEAALALERKDVLEAIGGLPNRKHHAAALAIETLRRAIESQV